MATKINYTEDSEISFFPPVAERSRRCTVNYHSESYDSIALVITQFGAIVFEDHVMVKPGNNRVRLKLDHLEIGHYELSLLTSNRISKKKFRLS